MLKTVFTEKAPKAIGPYSQGIKVQDFLFLSGQLPV
ncbi:Rid family hydrolase, partial [Bacillus velezensis]